jgi:hypothetical protein
MNSPESVDIQALSDVILDNRDRFAQIQQMNACVHQTSQDWQISRNRLDPGLQSEVEALLATSRAQATRMRQMCIIHAQRLQAARDRLEKEMVELNKGREFLESLKPVRSNYPKFIDSVY